MRPAALRTESQGWGDGLRMPWAGSPRTWAECAAGGAAGSPSGWASGVLCRRSSSRQDHVGHSCFPWTSQFLPLASDCKASVPGVCWPLCSWAEQWWLRAGTHVPSARPGWHLSPKETEAGRARLRGHRPSSRAGGWSGPARPLSGLSEQLPTRPLTDSLSAMEESPGSSFTSP